MEHVLQNRFTSVDDLVVEMNGIIDYVNKLEKRTSILELHVNEDPKLEWIEYYKDAPGPSIKKKY
jgi:hypothetical protein